MQVEQRLLSTVAETTPKRHLWQTIVTLFKLRVVSLLLLSAYGGAVLGFLATGQSSWGAWLILTVTGLLSAMGASAINQYLERERDLTMRRTARRPLATGEIEQPERILWLGIGMIAVATGLALLINLPMAIAILAGALIYVVIYTIWLKPRTSLNIVIGGAAGSCAVLSGGAALGAWADPAVWLLAALIFVWTPVHFWALALACRDDYVEADYPMLPTQVSAQAAAGWTALHTILTLGFGLALGLVPAVDTLYLFLMLPISLFLTHRTIQLWRTPVKASAWRLFHMSNLYLATLLLILLAAPIWR